MKEFLSSDAAVHFIGCGGAGTAPLMRIFHEKGFRISGSDLIENKETRLLRELGIPVFTGEHKAENLPDCGKLLLIHTSAADPENPEIHEAKRRNAKILRRGEALAEIAKLFRRVIAVSGSHGKTSVTGMLAYALKELGADPGYLVGGKVNTWEHSGSAGNGDLFITEGDESDGTNALLHSAVAIVTNLEDDHVWSLGGVEVLEENFRIFARQAEYLIYSAGEKTDRLFAERKDALRIEQTDSIFPPAEEAKRGGFQLRNAFFVYKTLERLGYTGKQIIPVLSRFPGVDRRMTLHYDTPALRIVEDYAHHPTELKASLEALRKTNPGRRLVVVFQPHRYARLERYFHEFAEELSKADMVYTVPVFAAWTASGKYDSSDLAGVLGIPAESLAGSWEDMAGKILTQKKDGDLLAVIGAGDIKDILPCLRRMLP